MPQSEQFEALILGSGFGGKLLAWHLAQSGRRTAVVERRWIGGSCPNIACLPSKNEIWSARIAHQAHHAAQFGTVITGSVTTDMAKVRQRKRDMVNREIELHLHNYKTSGAELIMGSGRFVASKTLEVRLNDGGTRVLADDQVSSTSARTRQSPRFRASRPREFSVPYARTRARMGMKTPTRLLPQGQALVGAAGGQRTPAKLSPR